MGIGTQSMRYLICAIDRINHRFGQIESCLGIRDGKRWKMKQERNSSKYTTAMKDILLEKALIFLQIRGKLFVNQNTLIKFAAPFAPR